MHDNNRQKHDRTPSLALATLIFLAAPLVAGGQSLDPAATSITAGPDAARHSFTIVGAATFANGTIKGDAFDRYLVVAGIRYGRVLIRNGVLTFSYTPELIPATWLFQPVLGDDHQAVQREIVPFTHTETTFGFGANPIGVELGFRPDGRLQPLIATGEGFLYFRRSVPSPSAAQFNFTVDVRLGFRVRLDHRKALSFEYIYHHLSNGYRAAQNPGVDSQMLCLGYVYSGRSIKTPAARRR